LKLTVAEIDSTRMLVHIRQGKHDNRSVVNELVNALVPVFSPSAREA